MSSEINDQATGNPVIDHLDLWSSVYVKKATTGRGSNGKISPYGIQKLRELILELAVRGKLVPQDPKDEPAAVLLEKVAEQKDRLVADREIKKPKKLPEITDEEMPFALLEGWEWARLQDVTAYIQRGKGPKYADEGEVRVVSQKCVQWSGFDLEQSRYVDDNSLDKYQQERFLQKNDLLWNSTGTGTVGRVNVLENNYDGTLVADSHVTVIRPLFLNSYYLWCYIAAPGIQQRIEPEHEDSLVSGTTKQVELNTSSVVPLVIPIPPLAEQHRIVAKVDELMALCDQLEQQQTDSLQAHQTLVETLLAALVRPTAMDGGSEENAEAIIFEHFDTLFTTEKSIDQLKKTILQLAVMGKLVPQDPNDEPASVLLEKISEEKSVLVDRGKIKKQKALPVIVDDEKPSFLPDGWIADRFGKVINLVSGQHLKPEEYEEELDEGMIPYLTGPAEFGETSPSPTRFTVERRAVASPGDVLITCKGSGVGKLNIADQEMAISRQLMSMRPIIVSTAYVMLLAESLEAELRQAIVGIAIPGISREDVTHAVVQLPPLEEQHRIVAKLDELIALCDTLKSRIQEAQTTQVHLADAVVEQAVA